MHLRRLLVVTISLILASQALSQVSQAEEAPSGKLGVFRGSGKPGEVADYESWLGRTMDYTVDFVGQAPLNSSEPWSGIDNPAWVCNQWQRRPSTLVLSAAMLPNTNFSLAAGAKGAYDDHWQAFGQTLVERGCEDAEIRLGWEFNGRFYPWAAGGREDSFVAYWRRIVDILRAVPNGRFRINWCPLAGQQGADVEAAWPGAEYVDVIGLDAYDTAKESMSDPSKRWDFQLSRPYGLNWVTTFAEQQGKPVSIPEWGVTVRRNDGIGGGDNPTYIKHMWEWMKRNNILYSSYFEVDAADADHRLMTKQFPKASAEFRRLAQTG